MGNLKRLVILLFVTASASSEQCTLPDVQNTRGECSHIRDCKYQLGRFRVGSSVTRCTDKGFVCCPKTPSISEKKCLEWREMLHVPPSFTLQRLEQPACASGEQVQLIVGGRDAEEFEYPSAASLGYGTDPNKLKFLCGATLISERYLLTAAHCVTNQRVGKPTYAVLGDITLDPKKDNLNPSPYRKVIKIANHIVHPDYKPPLIYNDIALLSLASPVEVSRYVLPACLASPLTTPATTPKKKVQVEACGWGITDASSQRTSNKLQAINITTVDNGACGEIYAHEPDKGFRYPNGIIKTQTCASGDDKDTCRGDSGGGLYVREAKCVFHIVGITSIGSKVCGLGSPAVYTTVASFQDWIESIAFVKG